MSTATESPPVLGANLGWLLSTVAYGLTTRLTAALRDLEVTPRAYCVLSAAMTGEHTQTELAQAVGLDKTTMVVTVDALEKAGLAERRPAAADRRARVIAVTEAGERMVAEADEIVHRVHREVLAELPADQREPFVGALTQLACGALSPEGGGCAQPMRRRAPKNARTR